MRSEIVGMISFVREKFVQNVVRIVENVREEIVVHVSSQLRRRGIVGGVLTKPDSTSCRCFETLAALVKPHHHQPLLIYSLLADAEDSQCVLGCGNLSCRSSAC